MTRNVALFALLVLLAAAGLTSSAQTTDPMGPSSLCHDAAVWHLKQAMRFSQAPDQAFHLGAAQAAETLDTITAGDCAGWDQDAARPTQGNPFGTVSGADTQQAAMQQQAVNS